MPIVLRDFYYAIFIFLEKRAGLIAAGATFYILLSIVPLVLLLVKVFGLVLGDVDQTQTQIFDLGGKLFPDAAPQVLNLIKEIISGPLKGEAKFTILNFVFLSFASLGFFNAVLKGVYLINGGKDRSLFRKFEGLILVGFSILVVSISLSAPTFLTLMESTLKNNFLLNTLKETIPQLKGILNYFSHLNLGINFLIKSNVIHFLLFFVYFTFLYGWLFDWKLRKREFFLGSFTFVSALLIAKKLFYIYIKYFRENLVNNYGDYYTYILGMMWIFLMMCFFFYGACFLQARKESTLTKNSSWFP